MRRRTRVIAAVVLVAATGVGWWAVRGSASKARAVASFPGRESGSRATSERRDAALALGTMPDDPWTIAENIAASTPSGGAEKSRCGVDQRPRTNEAANQDGERPARPAGAAYRAETLRLDAALRGSADPFDRAVADWLDIGDQLTPQQRVEAVAQQAMWTSDPRIYSLAYRACNDPYVDADSSTVRVPSTGGSSCALLSAQRWSDLDPGNAVPWMYVLTRAIAQGDETAEQAAFAQMASAKRFEDGLHAAAGTIAAQAAVDDNGLAADLDLSERAFQKSVGQDESFTPLLNACKDKAAGDANRAQQCEAIAELMLRHSDNLLSQSMGAAVYFRTTGDTSRREAIRAERVAMSRAWSPGTGLSDCGTVREGLKTILRSAQIGELAAARERVRQGVAP